ncbi:helix-turn-helix domain-containing protein [Burkholderia cenocepacia]|jgi:transcriptional regulator with XRE-family HTH domain|uniref:helix-turn-helix domain-containing protein n=1 Tax=Burkholderia cenocepacia TaxID=95486 RepID=UPI0004F887B0|nr:helix-turn-helix domain-containing protein [Burkholderia cenocepacia]AIO43913.1 helix-turn-helix family protein [Burkholderia cepacia]KGC05344.1 helix-turn-helix family protein [Burkholderia cepacia]MCG0583067.1 helix-turn-helix domain-containing protein [Burkholderia cenocepacia]MCW3524464.1 helix-turn-helix domain-containing protein [Burkholderia cenocepacia]MCW3614686.1 helix-turn-helix domain-containing protein [Burkholderia cenocepacia]
MTKKVNIPTDSGSDVETVSAAVADRIKAYRKERKVSLDELSRRAGVSKGMLVEIEKRVANPSIAILCRISAALGVSVADIVNVASVPTMRLIVGKDIPTLWSGPEGGSARLLAGTSGPNMIELWCWELEPGERFESPGHPQGTLELFHVEHGTLTVQVDGAELRVPAGCSAVARTEPPHCYANNEGTKLRFTMVVAELHQLATLL